MCTFDVHGSRQGIAGTAVNHGLTDGNRYTRCIHSLIIKPSLGRSTTVTKRRRNCLTERVSEIQRPCVVAGHTNGHCTGTDGAKIGDAIVAIESRNAIATMTVDVSRLGHHS